MRRQRAGASIAAMDHIDEPLRFLAGALAMGGLLAAVGPTPAQAAENGSPPPAASPAEDRPEAAALRLSEDAVLARFTTAVQVQPALRDRALALWRTHFAAQAATLTGRFATEEDWRPVLAAAAALVEEFLEESLLPRAGEWRANETGKVWVETLDPATGLRTRKLTNAAQRPTVIAPHDRESARPGQGDGEKPALRRLPLLDKP